MISGLATARMRLPNPRKEITKITAYPPFHPECLGKLMLKLLRAVY
ncbi:MAG TPA: hypothetical protein GXX47_08710 [Firmicutes bacterium]|nr:hypothetical protein [Bacillota bacterium]